jgi:hypothetical protein
MSPFPTSLSPLPSRASTAVPFSFKNVGSESEQVTHWHGLLTEEAQGLVLALPGVDLVDHPLHLLQVPAHQIQAPGTGEARNV